MDGAPCPMGEPQFVQNLVDAARVFQQMLHTEVNVAVRCQLAPRRFVKQHFPVGH